MKYIIYHLWIISLLFPLGMQAKVRLTSIWGDNMVLQQQSEVTFHGKASANSKITIEASWNHRKLTTRSDQHGNWNIQLPTPEAGGPYTITFSDGEALILKNILLGEVWFCSGQSNMEMPVRGFRGQPVYGSQPYIVAADSKRELRLFTVKEIGVRLLRKKVLRDIGRNFLRKKSETLVLPLIFRRLITTFIGYSCRTDSLLMECFQDRDLDG